MNDDTFWNIDLEAELLDTSSHEGRSSDEKQQQIKEYDEELDAIDESCMYNWVQIHYPPSLMFFFSSSNNNNEEESDKHHQNELFTNTLRIRTIKSNISMLLGSVIGEEIWDAGILFCAHLLHHHRINNNNNILPSTFNIKNELQKEKEEDDSMTLNFKNKNVLELGSGCGLVGLFLAMMGASNVLCSDYQAKVLDNLVLNLEHNYGTILSSSQLENIGSILVGQIDWERFYYSDDINESNGLCSRRVNVGEDYKERGDIWSTDSKFFVNIQDALKFNPDVIVGTALVYSKEGGAYAADTIYSYFQKQQVREVYVLQMPERQGFQEFLKRLENYQVAIREYDIDEEVYLLAQHMFKISHPREAFKLFVMTSP